MKRVFTATCIAAACMVGLAAQGGSGTSTAQDPSQTGGRGPRTQTVTGCLRAGDTAGTYMLSNAMGMQMGRRGGDAGMGSGATTTTAGGTTTGGGMAPGGGRGMTVMLSPASDVDLSAHVGHKIEVTGTIAGGGRRGAGDMASGGTGTTTGGATTTGGGAGTTAGGAGQGMGGRGRVPTLNVTAVKMISTDCGTN